MPTEGTRLQEYVDWLVAHSMLHNARALAARYSGRGSQWRHPYAETRPRAAATLASVWFTAGFSDRVSFALLEPAATLPLAIFFQLGTPFPEVQERAYASAIILTVIILIVSLLARGLSSRYGKHVIQ